MSPLQYTLVSNEDGTKNITVFRPGTKPLVAHSTHPHFKKIQEGVLAEDPKVVDLFDLALAAGQKFQKLTDRIMVANGKIFLDGDEMESALTEQIIRFLSEGVDDWKPLVAFIENLVSNPNEHSRKQLYDWVAKQKITITEDGMMLGYKGVNKGTQSGVYTSKHAGMAFVDGEVYKGVPIPQKVGSIVEMPRTEVMHNPQNDCDAGLHVGSYSYAKGFGPVVLEVIVNPRDVVSVPDSAWKLRTCRYTVKKVASGEITKPVVSATKPEKQTRTKVTSIQDLRKGDVFEDTDKRRAGRTFKVTSVVGDKAFGTSSTTGKSVSIDLERLLSRKYKRIRRGR